MKLKGKGLTWWIGTSLFGPQIKLWPSTGRNVVPLEEEMIWETLENLKYLVVDR